MGRARVSPQVVSGQALWDWWQMARTQATTAGVNPQELDWLLRAVSELDGLALRLGQFRHQPQVPLKMSLEDLNRLWQQRLGDRRPIQYLVGETPWRDMTLAVSTAVLIPRPETELIVDIAVQAVVAGGDRTAHLQQGLWVDLGTGSGAIALGLARALPHIRVLAVDLSPAALAVAKENVQRYNLGDRITLVQGSWFAPLTAYRGKLRAVVSNPPYIPSAVLPTLQPEVIDHEPTAALDGGDDGLRAIQTLIHQAPGYLVPGGLWLVEMMAGQGAAVQTRLHQQGDYWGVDIIKDLAGRDRFALGFRR
ncbi:peptide chain release factor N(5)-glutamine methyltransferase [Nodosilinea sp. P-1105]|uniref:peptide chain release factor N(5)-glutamine methyltransferase n=1 Tax=Nodosilinea sp. P-1105 TaxID=2546229 RepID=UPI00146F41C9|nr:peptide chain release factor N(5)-glutamine methyltransferase [Nodosilinea sp. P-1105]NMF84959.1 peptide chain release factor N(5)-glutamine methyltransferase [Nodosilinea sp. P-1105]